MSSTILGILASGGGAAAPSASYESIATATGTGSSGTITFSSIPGTYKHLQIRARILSSTGQSIIIRFNSDTGTNYASHNLVAYKYASNPATITSTNPGFSNVYDIIFWSVGTSSTASTPSALITDVLDYASTSKYKTSRHFLGTDINSSTNWEVAIAGGLWMSTSAITSITLALGGGNYTTSTEFALYGIKESAV